MKFLKIAVALLLLIAVIGAAFIAGQHMGAMPMTQMGGMGDMSADGSMSASGGGEKKPLYWVAPMDANFRRDGPGKSPMGMALVPVYDNGDSSGSDVSISSAVMQNLGVKTAMVGKSPFVQTVKAVGTIGWDESTLSMLHTRVEGWLEVFNIASEGGRVEAGDILFEVFSPALVSAQQEYLIARKSGNQGLTRASESRLLALGLSRYQVDELIRTGEVLQRMPQRAMRSGVVTDLQVRPGMYVTPGTNIATLADNRQMWLMVDVFESDAGWIKPGQQAELQLDAFPGERFSGEVSYIYPELNAMTRTLRVRIAVPNPSGRLKANMFGSAVLSSKSGAVLQLPREAVIRSGNGSRVITALGDGKFNVAAVETGRVSGQQIEILSGLVAGDRVVTSGQFLLDAEANGEQAMARLIAEKSAVPAVGVIDELLADNRVTISHQPVAELGWPSMTMDFIAPPELGVDQSMVGRPIRFTMLKNADGMWELMKLEPADKASPMDDMPAAIKAPMNTSANTPMSGPMSEPMKGSKKASMTSATVVSVDGKKRRIRLRHEAIQSLNMDAMTMRFNVADDISLDSFSDGEAVRFNVEMKPGKGMVITQLEKQQ